MTTPPGFQSDAARRQRSSEVGGRRGAALGFGGLFAGAAGAKSETLAFLSGRRPTLLQRLGPSDQSQPAGDAAQAGRQLRRDRPRLRRDREALASRWTASDHSTCTFINADTGKCDYQIAIGGSLLLGNDFPLYFTKPEAVAPVSEGTGAFDGAHGTLTDVDLPNSNNAILTIHLS